MPVPRTAVFEVNESDTGYPLCSISQKNKKKRAKSAGVCYSIDRTYVCIKPGLIFGVVPRRYSENSMEDYRMSEIERYEIHEEWAHSGIIKAGDFCFLGYCVGNLGGTVEEQINGAFDNMEQRLAMVGLTLENVVQMDCLFRDVWNIPIMEDIIRKRFHGKYPVRKSIQTEFADRGGVGGLLFQADAVAYCGK